MLCMLLIFGRWQQNTHAHRNIYAKLYLMNVMTSEKKRKKKKNKQKQEENAIIKRNILRYFTSAFGFY